MSNTPHTSSISRPKIEMKSIVFAGSMLAAWPAFAQYNGYQSDPLSHALLKGLVGGIQGAILIVIAVLIGWFRSKLRAKTPER